MVLLVNWYNNRLLPLIRQLYLIPNRIKEFRDLSSLLKSELINRYYIVC
jgi:hypothetical protein